MFEPVIYRISIPENITLRQQKNVLRKVSCVDGVITANEQIDRHGLIARANVSGFWGMATSSIISAESAHSLAERSFNNAKLLSEVANRQSINNSPPDSIIQLPEVSIPHSKYDDVEQSIIIDLVKQIDQYICNTFQNNISTRRVMVCVEGIEKYIRSAAHNHFMCSTIKRSCIYIEMGTYNADGVVITVADKKGVPYEIGCWTSLLDDSKEVADRIYSRLIDKKRAKDVCEGVFPCILHPDVAGILAHESIGHNVEADIVKKGSFARNILGRQIASEKVSVTDFANTAFGKPAGLPLFVDDEGTTCRDVKIIEKGILVNYLHDIESAKHFNTVPNGNARAYLAFDEPLIRMRNTAFHPGEDQLSDMISSIDHGYFLLSSSGGQADINGNFIFNVDMGYEIKKGNISHAIKDTTISGNAIDILSSISMVSKDFLWDITGLCSKYQSMILATGGPYIKCNLLLGKE